MTNLIQVFSGIAVLILGFATWAEAAQATGSDAKPNFVIFISDDHSRLDSEPYGSVEVRTPNMLKLAAAGMKFNQALVATP